MNEERKRVLQGPIWGEELMRLCAVLTSSKDSSPAQRALWDLVVKTAEVRKSYIAELYYYRQKLSCRVDFMKWYIAKHDNKMERYGFEEPRKYQSYKKHIVMLEEIMEVIDKFLDKGVGKYRITEKKCKEKKKSLKIGGKSMNADALDGSNVYVTELPRDGNDSPLATIVESPGNKTAQNNNQDIDHLEKEPRKKKPPGKDLKMRRAAGSATKLMAQALASMQKNADQDEDGEGCDEFGEDGGPPIPCFCLLQKNKPNIVRRLMVRAAIVKKADVRTFDKGLRDLHEKLGFITEEISFFRAVDGISVELMAEKGKVTKK